MSALAVASQSSSMPPSCFKLLFVQELNPSANIPHSGGAGPADTIHQINDDGPPAFPEVQAPNRRVNQPGQPGENQPGQCRVTYGMLDTDITGGFFSKVWHGFPLPCDVQVQCHCYSSSLCSRSHDSQVFVPTGCVLRRLRMSCCIVSVFIVLSGLVLTVVWPTAISYPSHLLNNTTTPIGILFIEPSNRCVTRSRWIQRFTLVMRIYLPTLRHLLDTKLMYSSSGIG